MLGITVCVKKIPEARDTKPIRRKSIIERVILSLNIRLRFGAILTKMTSAVMTNKKSSNLIETYVPGIWIKGNFG
ncbi:MAG: hypothetical protein NT162_02315 [Candidatus Woesebacteria bacterium]|nr:hypothetical protein [Candidatus Woesebacteria bacterium]